MIQLISNINFTECACYNAFKVEHDTDAQIYILYGAKDCKWQEIMRDADAYIILQEYCTNIEIEIDKFKRKLQ